MIRPLLLTLAAIAVIAFAVQGGEYGTLDLVRQRRARGRLERQIDSLSQLVDSLRGYRERLLRDPALQERIAREEFGMVRDKELLYRFVEPDSATRAARDSSR